jgi:hypothetical protein
MGSNSINAAQYGGNAIMGGANAQAAGTIGSANAWSNGIAGAANSVGSALTLKNLMGSGGFGAVSSTGRTWN